MARKLDNNRCLLLISNVDWQNYDPLRIVTQQTLHHVSRNSYTTTAPQAFSGSQPTHPEEVCL
jgi:hypothetical protein